MALPTFHDELLVGYEMHCRAREVALQIQGPSSHFVSTVRFKEVLGYTFADDAFGNVLLSLVEVDATVVLYRFATEISVSYRRSGAFGPWAADLHAANATFAEKGTRGFILESSTGMNGWILAAKVELTSAKARDAQEVIDNILAKSETSKVARGIVDARVAELIARSRITSELQNKVPERICGFCGKHADEVEQLIPGVATHICNECVALSSAMIAEQKVKDDDAGR